MRLASLRNGIGSNTEMTLAQPPDPAAGSVRRRPVGVAILGCGFVADFYMATLGAHPMLRVVGAHDRDPDRLAAFCRHHGVLSFRDLDQMLAAQEIELVLNLTNPASHFALTAACLDAGRHVYSEKPLAMSAAEAGQLAALAQGKGLLLAAAPASLLGETAQTMWKALRDGAIGRVRLVHANFHDGMIHRRHPERWRSASGAPWPVEDEFATGCTYEHAAYVLTWLAAFFGPARRVQAFAACQVPDKGVARAAGVPDVTEGWLHYDGDVLARVSCSVVAPPDRSITIIGDEGSLHVACVRDDSAPVWLRREAPGRLAAQLGATLGGLRNRLEHALRIPWSPPGAAPRPALSLCAAACLPQLGAQQAGGFPARPGGAGGGDPRRPALPAIRRTRRAHDRAGRDAAIPGTLRAGADHRLDLPADRAAALDRLRQRFKPRPAKRL
ncbi:MAG TPA: Gfo/Idh/MocA family oxidoreductase [Falsiroseomonas sp.]|jgi:predicted dehydrogenase|nr:Gfo/Idh/MocA family oxidoreductase [Falsiroseomonas sp.]